MDLLQAFLNLAIPAVGVCVLLCLWPALAIRSIMARAFHSCFPENMRGKIVLITGASSGIGERIAYEYARRGAVLVLIARREERLVRVADNCVRAGAMDVRAIRADVSKEEDCHRFIDDTINQYGRLDHLVNNAGIAHSFMFEDLSDSAGMTQIWATNFWGSVYPTFYALEHLKRTRGRIVVLASMASWIPHPRMSIYNASKAALLNFYDTLRMEEGGSIGGITIVTPLFTESEMIMGKFMTEDGEMEWHEDRRDTLVGASPVVYAEECAKAVVRGAVRGDRYVRTPRWGTVSLLYRVFAPELVDFFLCLLYLAPVPGRKDHAPLSKVLTEIPGVKALLYPSSLRNIHADKPLSPPKA